MFYTLAILYILGCSAANIGTTPEGDQYQKIGNDAGAVYSSIGSVLKENTYDYLQLQSVASEGDHAVSSLRVELSAYNWDSLLGASAASVYRNHLDRYIQNLEDANQQIHMLAVSLQPAVNKAEAETTGTASSLLPVPTDAFTDASDTYYPMPTSASSGSTSSTNREASSSDSAESRSKSKSEQHESKSESKAEKSESKSESRASRSMDRSESRASTSNSRSDSSGAATSASSSDSRRTTRSSTAATGATKSNSVTASTESRSRNAAVITFLNPLTSILAVVIALI